MFFLSRRPVNLFLEIHHVHGVALNLFTHNIAPLRKSLRGDAQVMAIHVKNSDGGRSTGHAWLGCDTDGTCVRFSNRSVGFRHRSIGVGIRCVLVPTRHVFESNDAVVIHVALPYTIFCLAGPSSAPSAVPRHPPTPYGFVGMHVVHIGNGAIFAKRENFRAFRGVLEFIESARVAGMVICAVVDVDGEDVIVFTAWIPRGYGTSFRVIDPNHVFYPLDFDHAIIDESIKGCKLFTGIDTPPEPLSTRFMQRTEDSRYTIFLQFKEIIGDVVNVCDDSFVSCAFGIPFGGAWLETCREIEISVFATVCRTLDIEGVFFI